MPTIDPFEVHTEFDGDVAEMTLTGKLDMSTFGVFQTEVESVLAKKPSRLVLNLQDLDSIANVGIRVLLFARQRMDISDRADIYAVAPKPRSTRRSCAPIRTRKTSTSSRATTRSATATASGSGRSSIRATAQKEDKEAESDER